MRWSLIELMGGREVAQWQEVKRKYMERLEEYQGDKLYTKE
jgi:hypothetical protein